MERDLCDCSLREREDKKETRSGDLNDSRSSGCDP
jgi:hypothetical protein